MSEIIVLIDYEREEDGVDQGIVMDMGGELALIASQLKAIESNCPPGLVFKGAYVLSMHEEQPTEPYVPDNAFGKQACGLDGSAQLPMGKRWFSLVMRVEAGFSGPRDEEE